MNRLKVVGMIRLILKTLTRRAAEMILLIRIIPERAMIRAAMTIPAATMIIPETVRIRRKEAAAKWQTSYKSARYPSIRISSFP